MLTIPSVDFNNSHIYKRPFQNYLLDMINYLRYVFLRVITLNFYRTVRNVSKIKPVTDDYRLQ